MGRLTTPEQMIGLWEAFIGHGAACDAAGQALKAQINAATTIAELDAIDISVGWPE